MYLAKLLRQIEQEDRDQPGRKIHDLYLERSKIKPTLHGLDPGPQEAAHDKAGAAQPVLEMQAVDMEEAIEETPSLSTAAHSSVTAPKRTMKRFKKNRQVGEVRPGEDKTTVLNL